MARTYGSGLASCARNNRDSVGVTPMSCRALASEPARRAPADGDRRAPMADTAAARIGASGEINPATVGAVASPSEPSACSSASAARAQRRRSSLTRNRETEDRAGVSALTASAAHSC